MSFSIKLISGLIQKGTNTFKLIKGKDVAFDQNNGALTSSNIDDNDIFLISDDSVTNDNDVKTITASNLKSYILPSTGNSGLVPAAGTSGQFLAHDGSFASLVVATSSIVGGIKIGYTNNGKNYAVELDGDNEAFVNVPWTDTVYALPLATNSARGGVQIGYTESGKNYPVELSSEKMYVNVPWTDTVYTLPTASASTKGGVKVGGNGLSISGELLSVDINGISTTMTAPFDDDKIIIYDNSSNSIQNLRITTLKTHILNAGVTSFYGRDDESIEGDTDVNFTMLSHRDLIFHVNKDGDALSDFKFLHGSSSTEVAKITNAGNLEILGDLQVKGDNIKGNSNSNGISFDSSGNTTIAGDLAISGNITGTINLTGSVTGNISLPSSGSLTLPSASTIKDSSNNKLVAPLTRTIDGTSKTFTQVTNLEIEGSSEGRIFGPTDNDLIIRSEKNLIFQVDADNDSTNNFVFRDGGNNTIASLTEAGVLTLNSALPIASGGTGISSVSGNADRFLKVNSSANAFELADPTELVQDIVGAMFTSNTETRISATYQDSDGTIDLVVDDMTANTQLTQAQVEDIVGAMLDGAETGISVTYNSTANNIDFAVSDLTVAGDSGSTGMTPGDTLTIAGGSNITTSMSGDTLTISASSSSNTLELVPSSVSDPAAGVNSAIIIKEGNTTTVAGKVYYLAPNGTWVLANAGAEGTRSGLLGVAVGTNSTTNGMVVKGVVVMSGHSGSAGNGKTIYLSETDGTVTTSAPSSVRILGSIISHNSSRCEIYFNPDNFNGQAANPAASFTDDYSLTFDGTGDYATASIPTDWGKSTGTYSLWINLNITDDASKYNLCFTTGDGSFNDFIIFMYFKSTTNKYAFLARQRRTISGTTTDFNTVAQQSSTYHGRPLQRTSAAFNSIQQNYNSIRTSDTWTHIAVTWDKDDTYTYNGTTYNGNQILYVNGVKVGDGTGTFPSNNNIGTSTEMDTARTTNLTTMYVSTLSASHGMANQIVGDIAIWSTSLNAANIAAIYNSGTPTDLTTAAGNYNQQGNLVGYWKMENNANDSSSNSNNLTLYGDTTYSSSTP